MGGSSHLIGVTLLGHHRGISCCVMALPYRSTGFFCCAVRFPCCRVCRSTGGHASPVAAGSAACVAWLTYCSRIARLCGAYPDVLCRSHVSYSGTSAEVEASWSLVPLFA